jgi:hypothetical protein
MLRGARCDLLDNSLPWVGISLYRAICSDGTVESTMKKTPVILVAALAVTAILGITVYFATAGRRTMAAEQTQARDLFQAEIAEALARATPPPSTVATAADIASKPRAAQTNSNAMQPALPTAPPINAVDRNEQKRDMAELALAYQEVIEQHMAQHKVNATLGELNCFDYICSGELLDGTKEEYLRWGKLFTYDARTSMRSMMYGARRMPDGRYMLTFTFNAARETDAPPPSIDLPSGQ